MNIGKKLPNKIWANQIQQSVKRIRHHDQAGISPWDARMAQHVRITRGDIPHEQNEHKNDAIISIDAEVLGYILDFPVSEMFLTEIS